MVKINRVILRVAVVVAAIVGLLNLADGIYAGAHVDAATSGLTMAATIEPSMTLTLSDSSKILNIIPNSSGSFNSTSITVGAYSNGMVGYTLTMTPDHTDLTGSGTNSIPTLSAASTCTGGSTCSSSNFSAGYWGIAVNDGTYGPAATTDLVTVQTSDPSVASNEFTIYLGANLDLSIPTDNYSTTLNFALVSSTVATYDVTFEYDSGISSLAVQDISGTTLTPTTSSTGTATYALDYANTYTLVPTYASSYRFQAATLTGDGFFNDANLTYTVGSSNSTVELASFLTYMQDFASLTSSEKTAILASMTEDTQYQLIDNRDGKTYWVSKLKDGNVWMLDNLALDLTALTQEQLYGTGANAGKMTNASNTTLGYLKGATVRNPSTDSAGNYATAAVSKAWTSSVSYIRPLIAVDSTTSGVCSDDYCVNSDKSWSYDSVTSATINGVTSMVQGKIGVYYNYCAASAGSYCYGTSDTDASTSSGNATEDICPAGWHMPSGDTANGSYYYLYNTGYSSNYNNFVDALSTPLSGYFYGGRALYQGSSGSFWSSTRNSNNNMYLLYVLSTYVSPQGSLNRRNGFSVRCIVGS